MKTSTAILYIMVTLSLLFSLTALIIVAGNNNLPNNPSITNKPTSTQTAAPLIPPTITNPPASTLIPVWVPSGSDLTFSYETSNRQNLNNGQTQVTLTIYIQYYGKVETKIDYSQFYLYTYSPRMTVPMNQGTANPQNTGTATLDPTHTTETIQLTFEFRTLDFNGMDVVGTAYQLKYKETT
ncbi:MAG: hypothetical protein ACQCN3_11935 [Candidatus Bathyarchaeia archaeon]|jgi:hypothetical protein